MPRLCPLPFHTPRSYARYASRLSDFFCLFVSNSFISFDTIIDDYAAPQLGYKILPTTKLNYERPYTQMATADIMNLD